MDDRELDQRLNAIEEGIILLLQAQGIIPKTEGSDDETNKSRITKKDDQP